MTETFAGAGRTLLLAPDGPAATRWTGMQPGLHDERPAAIVGWQGHCPAAPQASFSAVRYGIWCQ